MRVLNNVARAIIARKLNTEILLKRREGGGKHSFLNFAILTRALVELTNPLQTYHGKLANFILNFISASENYYYLLFNFESFDT